MCVGVPMKIVEIDYPMAVAEAKGVRRTVSLMLLPENEVKIGDYVMVHVGNAIEKIDEREAEEVWKALDEVLEILEKGEG
ncbi:hydrogenase expression/formation protein HypC [Balnearium lithotrophicum]|uniref:Hydrogenase expression/formation protein HypC n=1 Tax=Balnearium lithotrophicum TaxID=223788 RepID=A0A521E6H6_9BACT|nr:HypC/HybG/HupF family hydrogenase formation chaperone [Balnearium lithotrophicum]SMO79548.1 hydrogenase expression/formation protein HypC [Balnearium lithotrophicum]